MIKLEQVNELFEELGKIEDPRKERGVRYEYKTLLLIMLCAVLSGNYTGVDMEYYTELNFEYFKDNFNLKSIPSHDTFSRIIQMTNFESLSKVLNKWLETHFPEEYEKYNGNNILHIDGKAVKAGTKKSEGQNSVYLLNCMYEGGSISLYTKQIGDKENEKGQIVNFLSNINIKDTIVTIDAAGTTSNILNYIEENDGYYLVPVKKNQKHLFKAINDHIETLYNTKDEKGINDFDKLSIFKELNKKHGRVETYSVHIIDDIDPLIKTLGDKSFYTTIAKIGIIDKKTIKKVDGKEDETLTRSLMITNLESIDAESLHRIKLSHWNIEAQHWILDVQLNEDRCNSRKNNAIINNSILKRFSMKIKKYYTKFEKLSLNRFHLFNGHSMDNVLNTLFGYNLQ